MAIKGRKPNPEGQRRHNIKPTHGWIEVDDAPFTAGPKLTRTQPSGASWPKRTKDWWVAICQMPHCALWEPSDWQFAQDTAIVAAAFHAGDSRRATELRQREKILGTTLEARRDLRIRYVQPVPEEERQGVTAINAYKRRLITEETED